MQGKLKLWKGENTLRIMFVRHGETNANADGRLQGHMDYPLSEKGKKQARKLRDSLREDELRINHIYSSPLRRTKDTAQIVGQSWSAPIEYVNSLKEYDIGIFSGLTWEEIDAKHAKLAREFLKDRDWDKIEKAESFKERSVRAHSFLSTVIKRHSDDDVVIVFTHGGILQNLLAVLMGTEIIWGMKIHNTALFDFTFDMELWASRGQNRYNPFFCRINRFNDASHLDTG